MIVGITGSIGSGKTTATTFFPKPWKRISADSLGHALLRDRKVVARLTLSFGKDILSHGKIVRSALAQKAFSNKTTLKKLNIIVHPTLRKQIIEIVQRYRKQKRHAVLDCALLQELQLSSIVDYQILITAPAPLCRKRAKRWDKEVITERTALQKQSANPDFLIANTGSKNDLKKAILKIVTFLGHARQ